LDPKLAARLTERLARLTEAGRVLSISNEKAIRAAIDALQAVLSKVAGGETAESAEIEAADTTLSEAEAILAQNDSYEGRRMRVQKALTDRHRALRIAAYSAGIALDPEYGCYPWIRDLYDDAVIFEQDSKLYRSDYTVDDDGAVTLADPVAVTVSYVLVEQPASTTESDSGAASTETAEIEVTSELVPLIEKAVRANGTVPICIITPGWGSSGYYAAEMLKRDGPKVFTKGLHMYADHPTATEEAERPERSVRDLAGVLETDARWDAKGPAGPGLYADARPLNGFGEALDTIAPHIGTSIRSFGTASAGEAEGRTGQIIDSLVRAESVDFVTKAGRGGSVLSLMESARGQRPSPTPGGAQVTEISEQEAKTLREAMSGLERQLAESQAMIARQNEAILLRDARDLITSVLAETEMPDLTRKRLLDDLVKRPIIKEGQLDHEATTLAVREAVKAEMTYLAQATGGTGQIRGMGTNGVTSPQWQEQAEAKVAASMRRLGLSETAATAAAHGR
jgi:hypothetical protein